MDNLYEKVCTVFRGERDWIQGLHMKRRGVNARWNDGML